MLTVEEVAVLVEACNASGNRRDLSGRAGARVPGAETRVVLAAIDRLLRLDDLRLDRRDQSIEVTSRGRQTLRQSLAVLEDLVRVGNILRYQ